MAVIDVQNGRPRLVEVVDMPVHKIKSAKGTRRKVDLYALAGILAKYKDRSARAFVEDPHSMPKQGVASSFNFGFSCGAAQMAVAAALIPMKRVEPRDWKKALGLKTGADKDESRRLASSIIPLGASSWADSDDHGRAEAVLIAVYGSRL